MSFPIDLSKYTKQEFSLEQELNQEELETLQTNIQLVRDAIVFFTSVAAKKGLSGHTGGAYDMVPEAMILTGFMNNSENRVLPVLFDEAGHRVALQYIFAVLNGHMNDERLLEYREYKGGLYGHPELDVQNGIFFSSGRLGHMWNFVNGVAHAHPEHRIVILGSDGSQMEGNDAEAARYAVAQSLDVHMFVDDNDVTISGHPSVYMKGFSVEQTLNGHGLKVDVCDGTKIDIMYDKIRAVLSHDGPTALVTKRAMAEGIPEIEGTTDGHEAVPPEVAKKYLAARGYTDAVRYIDDVQKGAAPKSYRGSSDSWGKVRNDFGIQLSKQIQTIPSEERKNSILVIDSDLEGSCGLQHVRKMTPEVLISGGIMERNNFSVAAGFGSKEGHQGVFATFSAFSEMIISELTMARLNEARVLVHFSHSGVDDMADNTCHFGVNTFFLDNAFQDADTTMLYFPADVNQLEALMPKVFHEKGIRFIFSTRSALPEILAEDGSTYFGERYRFTGNDEIIRTGKNIYIITFGDMLYRALDAVERLRDEGINPVLVNKPLLNIPDEAMMKRLADADAVLVVESLNKKTGLGIRFGTWLLQYGFHGIYRHMGTNRPGQGGLHEQILFQHLAPDDIMKEVKAMVQQSQN
ncbi:MAG: transketolase [Spirochaetes bacterium]|jgi:transketolase|nr:transketolase [Spirochaetota bacterium]